MFFFGDRNQTDDHIHIYNKVPDFHRKIYRDLANEYYRYYITAPSEFGKTTCACVIYPLYRAYYELDKYITIGGANQDISKTEYLENIERELTDNDKLCAVYSNMKPKYKRTKTGRVAAWSSDLMELINGVVFRALGCMGKIRGRKKAHWRPTLVIVDDPEVVEDTRSPSKLLAHRDWLKRDVLFRVDRERGKVRVIGNLLSDDCLIAKLREDPSWKGTDYSALDEQDKSIWEDRFSTISLHKERQNYINAGEYDVFQYERMNIVPKSRLRSLDGYQFHNATFKRENEQNVLYMENDPNNPILVNTYLGVDPEVDAEDYGPRAFITIGVGWYRIGHQDRICTFVLDYLFQPLDPSDIIDEVAKAHQKYFYTGVAIEINSMQRVFRKPMEDYQNESTFWHKHPFQFYPIGNYNKNSKVQRILRLQPKCKRGQLFITSMMREIMNEMDEFSQNIEKGLHVLDALEMADRISAPPNGQIRTYHPDTYRDLRGTKPYKRSPINDHSSWMKIPTCKL